MKISLVIRSRNDIGLIEETMKGLLGQKLPGGVSTEFINIDNGSSDGTAEAVARLNPGGIVINWPSGDYVPGKVLNEGVRRASGDIVVFHNSDCVPLNENYLAELIAPLSSGEADIVFARQLPRSDARPLVCKDYDRAFGDGSCAASWRHMFSLAASAAPRALLLAEPFNETLQYSEDIEWSYRLRRQGRRIGYASSAGVCHSHNYTFAETRRRFFNEGVADAFIFNEKPRFFRGFLLTLAREYLRDIVYLFSHGCFVAAPRELLWRFVQRHSHYLGVKKAAAGDPGRSIAPRLQ